MRDFREVQEAARIRAEREFNADIAARNKGIKNISKAPVKEPVQEVKEVKEVSYSNQERADIEQSVYAFRVWVQEQVEDGTKEAQAKSSI